MNDAAISLEAISKRYGEKSALRDVGLSVMRGEVFGLLGANGAGKTTLIEILLGLRRHDSGTGHVLGVALDGDRQSLRARIGYVTQEIMLPPLLTAHELVSLHATFHADPERPDVLMERLGLGELRRQRAGRLSGGERQRLAVALALVGRPELLILDEPTAALDAHGRAAVWEALLDNGGRPRTIILSTHRIDEAETFCSTVGILREGALVALDHPARLVGLAGQRSVIRFVSASQPPSTSGFTSVATPSGWHVELSGDRLEPLLETALQARARGELTIDGLTVDRPKLEHVFLALTDGRVS